MKFIFDSTYGIGTWDLHRRRKLRGRDHSFINHKPIGLIKINNKIVYGVLDQNGSGWADAKFPNYCYKWVNKRRMQKLIQLIKTPCLIPQGKVSSHPLTSREAGWRRARLQYTEALSSPGDSFSSLWGSCLHLILIEKKSSVIFNLIYHLTEMYLLTNYKHILWDYNI